MSDYPNDSRPQNVGILAMDLYFPKRYVSQEDLELADKCIGKYTVGLGQQCMSFVDDREDIVSIFKTVLHSLISKYDIDPKSIGRLEIGTETLIDKSKSVKTSLLDIFGENTDLEGVTNVNACYGGTAALLNSIAWIESSDWDGRFAIVVCGDIAVYEAGPARPTGGCGAVAILLGENAPLVLEPGVRASHTLDVYDFYKPLHSEYAMVDGRLSQKAYLTSVDHCYMRYKDKYKKRNRSEDTIKVTHFDHIAFHSPYNKLAQKGFGRFLLIDSRDDNNGDNSTSTNPPSSTDSNILSNYRTLPLEDTLVNSDIENALKSLIKESQYLSIYGPPSELNRKIGNCYTASVFISLFSLLCEGGSSLIGKRIGMFSFGSGSIATLYSFIAKDNTTTASHGYTLELIKTKSADIIERLNNRTRCSVSEFTAALDIRAKHYGVAPLAPLGDVSMLFPGTFYLDSINDKHHRIYSQTPMTLI